MTATADLLVEIGTEELPPKALLKLSGAFGSGVQTGITACGLKFADLIQYATPRRLAVRVNGLEAAQPDREIMRRGPAVTAAFGRDGTPTPAATGFATSCGVDVDRLERLQTDKGEWLAYRAREPGRTVQALIPDIVNQALARLPIPKRMRWGAGSAEFVRPVHWVVLLYGADVIDAEILGVRANHYTRGHRFHHPAPIRIDHPDDYVSALENRGYVIPGFAIRRERIRNTVTSAAGAAGGIAMMDEELLEEVTALNEWPVALCGSFDERFLELPAEVLVATMQGHQRYFPLRDADGRLLPRFIAVANLESRDPEAVRHGNERVIRPRLSDADFFWNQDRGRPLAARLEHLRDVIFQKQLGTLYDKTARVEALTAEIARLLGGDVDAARRASTLSRCDLLTAMVGEFPELQGVMGRYYAAYDGETGEIAAALDEMYKPRFAGDAIPATATGRALAIADRLDTLTGIFSIGELPTGEKDPFGLRRAALGTLRIIIEGGLDLDLAALIGTAAAQFGGRADHDAVTARVFDFMIERLRAYCLDGGVTADVFEAVQAVRPTRPLDFAARLRAVTAFRGLPAAASLAAANKRIANILRKAGGLPDNRVNVSALAEAAERRLWETLQTTTAAVDPRTAARDYTGAMVAMAALREAVDAFFDSVLVMCDDEAVRNNRLALLRDLRALFLRVADISRLQ